MLGEAYGGWTNYETYKVKWMMDDNEETQLFWEETSKRIYDESRDCVNITRNEEATLKLANILKSHHEDAAPEVNWCEIAESLLCLGVL